MPGSPERPPDRQGLVGGRGACARGPARALAPRMAERIVGDVFGTRAPGGFPADPHPGEQVMSLLEPALFVILSLGLDEPKPPQPARELRGMAALWEME